MSRFSGKYDLYDSLFMTGDCDLDYLKRCKIFIGYSLERGEDGRVNLIPGEEIHIESMKDVVPYFPHIIILSYGCDDGRVICISEKSWPDMELERFNKWGCQYGMYDYYKKQLADELEKYEDET